MTPTTTKLGQPQLAIPTALVETEIPPSSLGSRTPKATDASSIAVDDYLSQLSAVGGDYDLAFVILTNEMKQRDQDISKLIKSIEINNGLRDKISKRLDQLRDLKTVLNGKPGKDKGDDAEMSLQELNKHVSSVDAFPDKKQQEAICAKYGLQEWEFKVDPTTGKVSETSKGYIGASGKAPDASYRINSDMVEQQIQKLNGQLQRIDSSREIDMIKLNSLINKKSQAAQLLSNIMKKDSDTKSAVISNYR